MLATVLDMLICPVCKGQQLRMERTKVQDDEIWSGEILCETCSQIYPIREGIPCLLSKDRLEIQEGPILQKWIQKMKEIEKDIIDEDQRTYKDICEVSTNRDEISEDSERLLWEKKLYIDNQVLREELGVKFEAKWAVAKDNIRVRNDHVFRFIEESVEDLTGMQILNVGPGIDDDITKRLESKGIDMINCDIILDPLVQLRSDKKIECLCADLKSLPFKEGTFDVVFCFHVIHHINPIEHALSEAMRVLKPDGFLFITEVNTNHLLSLMGRIFSSRVKRFLRKCVRKYTGTSERIYKPSPYEQVIPSRVVINAMSKIGFGNIARKTAVHSPMCFPDYIISFWNKMGFGFPKIFDPFAFEYLFFGTKS